MKIKNLILMLLLVVGTVSVRAQNKIGDNPTVIQSGSLLELESLTKGLRLPRIVLNDVHLWTLDGTPVTGMLIFNETGTTAKGIYYWSTELTQWVRVVSSAELTTLLANNTTVSNTVTGNTLSTTVNGVAAHDINIVNSNSLNVTNGLLTSTVNGVASSPSTNVLTTVNNGLSTSYGNVKLGGTLIKPTTLTTTATNTLSITGLQNGTAGTDSLLAVAPNTGIIRRISGDMLDTNAYKLITIASSNGQKRFVTPAAITDIKKLQVYRNGINIEFIQADATHIDLEDPAACYVDDEIKIIQLK